jgi:hypothetical protein
MGTFCLRIDNRSGVNQKRNCSFGSEPIPSTLTKIKMAAAAALGADIVQSTGATRINRGFHRLGAVCALPVLILGLWLVYNQYDNPTGTEKEKFTLAFPEGGFHELLAGLEDGRTLKVRGTDKAHVTAAMDGFFAEETKSNRMFSPESGVYTHDGVAITVMSGGEVRRARRNPDYGLPLTVLGCSLLIYGAARALGWIISGFVAA